MVKLVIIEVIAKVLHIEKMFHFRHPCRGWDSFFGTFAISSIVLSLICLSVEAKTASICGTVKNSQGEAVEDIPLVHGPGVIVLTGENEATIIPIQFMISILDQNQNSVPSDNFFLH